METKERGEELVEHSASWKSTATLNTFKKLNLGCGHDYRKDWVNVDFDSRVKCDLELNLFEYPWKGLEDNTYSEVVVRHFLEHVPEPIGFMDELWRVCAPFAEVSVIGPYWSSVGTHQDPTHKRGLCVPFFHYFSSRGRLGLGVDHYPIKADFTLEKSELIFHPDFEGLPQEHKEFALDHYINVVDEL